MEIYTIATSDDYDVKANNNIYLKKVSYTFEESNRLLEVAKNYYYTYLTLKYIYKDNQYLQNQEYVASMYLRLMI